MTRRARLSVVGPFPPPVHGAAEITRHIADAFEGVVEVERIAISPVENLKGIPYHLSRLARVLKAATILASGRGPVYLSAAGGLGLSYNVFLAVCARLVARPILIHHHSFAYLTQKHWLAVCLVKIAGRSATHICLCSRMAELLASGYRAHSTIVVSNAAFLSTVAISHRTVEGGPVRIGHLGNLSVEKGLDLVIDTAELLLRRGVLVELVLAGPAADDQAGRLLNKAREKLGSQVIALGPVYGKEKKQFFDSIDLFAFPTRYANEAQPLVVFEALAHGVPVIASARGCIPEQLEDTGLIIESDEKFVGLAVDFIAHWLADCAAHAIKRISAHRQFNKQHNDGLRQLADLIMRVRAIT